ncbi:NUDIX hydrolase [Arthrobacter sp. I2-34]|uniref:NUDIX hydrolase n=1 Tax=Arthrobacter hankyongi TaxID=2904801 RepID=A0ABS9L4D1_9MICC|nr:NUDIX hydrolase [Arthrobacter hankyongi]MCG2621527.1 NUDIX hydrolase [Arthrobacter hankyongi]
MEQDSTQASAGAPTVPGPITVTAAGALCWRVRNHKLQVLLIHRPRYKDWSWPKGKLDAGETTPECAVREVREEIQVDVQLGIPLPTVHYRVPSGIKEVFYWAARLEDAEPVPDGTEVDKVTWCQVTEALTLLSNPSDREPLEHLVTAYSRGDLETYPFVVVRHAKAKPRSNWSKAEGERPLAATGRRQALAVCRMLMVWRPGLVATSPWQRCVQTVTPYALDQQLKIRNVPQLTEHAADRSPKKARAAVEALLDKHQPAAVCTHRPVLPQVIKVLEKRMSQALADKLPSADPYLRPGAVIVCQVSVKHRGRIVSVEQFDAYDD